MVRFKQVSRIFLLSLTLLSTVQPSIIMAMQPGNQRQNQRAQARQPQRNHSLKAEIAGIFAFLIITGIVLYLVKKIGFDQANEFLNHPRNPQPEPQPIPRPNPIPQPTPQPIPQPQPRPQPHPHNQQNNAQDNCPICLSSPQDVGPEQVYITACCNNFICKNDIDKLERTAHEEYLTFQNPEWRTLYSESPEFTGWPDTHEHATCPICRHNPLQAVKGQKIEVQPAPAPVPAPTPAPALLCPTSPSLG